VQLRPLPLALLVLGCAAPPAPAPSREAALPVQSQLGPLEACQGNLSGLWRHSEDDGFRYVARDDGGVLVLQASRARADGGTQTSEVVLVRSPGNFVGAVGAARIPGDGGCAALFPAEVVSCADAGLLVATVDRLRVDANCHTLEPAAPRRLHRLVRVSPDAGA
jgi:hypothetical protein